MVERIRSACLLALILLLNACGGGPPPKLYLLEPVAIDAAAVAPTRTANHIRALGISIVELPDYADNAQIASLTTDGIISLDSGNRWAEEPADAISRLLADRLRRHAAATVLLEPWPRDYNPVARVTVIFDRLLREPQGGAEMAGQILLLSGDGRTLLEVLPFSFVHFGRNTDRREYFTSVSQGIDELAQMTVRALQKMSLKS
ncbi:MAG: membrane integrity-associated transporter subunit PqiC [Granulosicoccus sp.]|nr:membrane integrity-associated transporter subunit PqiC [Granulosicoccus sp.]